METQAEELEVLHENGHNGGMALEAISRAEIDMQISTARRFPRPPPSKIKADMLSMATMDEETAGACCYALPRGGKMIKGPSIRLAEIAISSYGNLRAGSRVIATETTGPTPHVVVQSVVHDLEKNVAITIEKRRRITKKKSKSAIDEDDVNLACNACSSIALRDATFKVIPLALIKPVYEAARKVAVGEVKSLVERRAKVMERLNQMGVFTDRILSRVEARKVEDIDLEKLEVLIGLGTAIKDGEATLEEAFPVASDASLVKTEDASNPDLGPVSAEGQTQQQRETRSREPASAVGGAVAGAPSAQPAEEPQKTPQQQLADVVIKGGYNFTIFQAWAKESGNINGADAMGSFDDVPSDDAKRLLRSTKGLLSLLKAAKEKGAQ